VSEISKEDIELCKRVDFLLKKAEADKDSLYDFATENEEIIKYAFLARAVVRELIDPKPELFESIASIEEEFAEFANQIESEVDGENDEDADEEED
jgi:hypothetical protein